MDLKKYIDRIDDFPKKGIIFRDINSLINNPKSFQFAVNKITSIAKKHNIDVIASPGARGFLFGAPVAYKLGKKFVAIRKPNKLPGALYRINYSTEYSEGIFEVQKKVISKGDKVLIVDDLLATGGTNVAMAKLIDQSGGTVIASVFVIDINLPESQEMKKDFKIYSLVNY